MLVRGLGDTAGWAIRPGAEAMGCRVLVQTREPAGDDEEMQRVVPIEKVFKGRPFDRQIIVLW